MRKNRKSLNKKIEMNDWKEYFMKLLKDWTSLMEKNVIRGNKKSRWEGREQEDGGDERIWWKKMKSVVRRLKEDEACRIDGIPNWTWR